ncbi:MAG: glucose-1-phosphate adenylyltransferase, partial [bacterium]
HPVAFLEASQLGLLQVDESGLVGEFIEKPKDPKVIERFLAPLHLYESQGKEYQPNHCLASMGNYVFETKVLQDLLKDKTKTDFGKEIIPDAIGKYRVLVYPFFGYWKDIGTIKAFFDANIEITKENSEFKLNEPKQPIYTHTRSLPPSRILKSEINDSIIGEGADIQGAHITNSVIGVRSVIQENTRLNEVVMFGSDYYEGEQTLTRWENQDEDLPPVGIGKNCVIERAFFDKNARIGDGVIIRPKPDVSDVREENYWIRDGITVIPSGTIL